MSEFIRLFNKADHKNILNKMDVNVYPPLAMIEIPALRFEGKYTSSPDGKYVLAWRDYANSGSRKYKGRYFLLDEGAIVTKGNLVRPANGRVANNGTFILCDTGSPNAPRGNTLHVFRVDGSEILKREFRGSFVGYGLSDDGGLAVFHPQVSLNQPDDNRLEILDLEDASVISSWRPEISSARSYEFTEDIPHILVFEDCGFWLRYTLDGKFLNRDLWINHRLDQGNVWLVRQILNTTKNKPPAVLARRMIASCNKDIQSRRSAEDDNVKSCAYILKYKGACLEVIEDFTSALACYEEALALDPKIGVKRRYEQLRKRLDVKADGVLN